MRRLADFCSSLEAGALRRRAWLNRYLWSARLACALAVLAVELWHWVLALRIVHAGQLLWLSPAVGVLAVHLRVVDTRQAVRRQVQGHVKRFAGIDAQVLRCFGG